MMRRLRVRTRLMAVIVVPLALLLVVALPEVRDRVEQADAADQAAATVRSWQAVDALVGQLQQERLLSAAARAGARDEVQDALRAQRALTDSALDAARGELEGLAGGALGDAADDATQALSDLDTVRGETDVASSIVPWNDPFAPVLDALLRVQEAAGAAVARADGGDGLAAASLVARSKEAVSAQASHLVAAAVWDELRGDLVEILASLRADELAFRTAYLSASPDGAEATRRSELQTNAVIDFGRTIDAVLARGDLGVVGGREGALADGTAASQALAGVAEARAAEAATTVADLGQEARQERTLYAGLAAVGLLAALLVAAAAARSIVRPLGRLTAAADELAEERLPRLVEALRNPGDEDERYLAATVQLLEAESNDELGRLSRAFNSVQSVAVDVAAEQAALLRKGISDLYVNLARRNQSLIERQIQLLDRLEAGEQDPEVLEHLYQLDHLATRMRRNAESLLVLAGADAGPRRGRALSVPDVVRAALSEVEDYERIDLGELAPGVVQGLAVSDVAHLLAELLENATHYSAPSTRVRVEGSRTGGSYQLMVSDEGIGIPDDQIRELNEVLRDPPVTGLALGRSLGCLVAARLAARHGITVRLRSSGRGVTAYVVLPRALMSDDEPLGPDRLEPQRLERVAAAPTAPPAHALAPGAGAEGTVPAPPAEPAVPAPVPARLADALPRGARFESGLQSLLAPGEARGPEGAAPPIPSAGGGDADPVPSDAGTPGPAPLARRVPGASTGAFEPVDRDAAPVRRSPDQVRSLLSRYRAGLQAGRTDDRPRAEGERP